MLNWDKDSAQLSGNLSKLLENLRDLARVRAPVTLWNARQWQRDFMEGLEVPSPEYVGKFRGEEGIENIKVRIGTSEGVDPAEVATEVRAFEKQLQLILNALDQRYPHRFETVEGVEGRPAVTTLNMPLAVDADGTAAVIDLAAWAHSEWIRIHPFVNGNGRTARIWANFIFMRYGLPPVVQLRPRPESGYGAAAAMAMKGDWRPMAILFRRMIESEV